MVPKPASIEAPSVPFDLVIHAGRVVCPATGLDGPGAVAIVGGRIAAAGPGVGGPAREVLRLPDAVLLPGLVDLHAHPARGESRYGVDPDVHLLPFGTTTVLAQGEAGALNLDTLPRRRDRTLADAGPARDQPVPAGRGDARRELRGPGGRRRGGLRGRGAGGRAERRARDLGDRRQPEPPDVRPYRPAGRHGRGPRGRERHGAPAPVRAPARRRLGAQGAARASPAGGRGHVLLQRLPGGPPRRRPGPGRGLGGPRAGHPLRRGSRDGLVQLQGGGAGHRGRAFSRTRSRRTGTSGTSRSRRATTCRGRSRSSSRRA